MKRSHALQPLSRERHTALTLAKACERAAQSADAMLAAQTCQRASLAYANELEPHFRLEETSLPLVERTLTDHQQLRVLVDALQQNDGAALGRFGKGLAAHVRFEERELLPALEDLLQT